MSGTVIRLKQRLTDFKQKSEQKIRDVRQHAEQTNNLEVFRFLTEATPTSEENEYCYLPNAYDKDLLNWVESDDDKELILDAWALIYSSEIYSELYKFCIDYEDSIYLDSDIVSNLYDDLDNDFLQVPTRLNELIEELEE